MRHDHIKEEHKTFTDAHRVTIHYRLWRPATTTPHAIVQISHGIGEHSRRYTPFACALAHAGFAVFADDHRGHGETGRQQHAGNLSKLGRLGPGGLAATETAIRQLAHIAAREYPHAPLTLFAHSWGSLMAQRQLNTGNVPWRAVILSGSTLRTARHMNAGLLNARHAKPGGSGFEWLSRDLRVGWAFAADELCFLANIPKLFGLRDALRLYGRPVTPTIAFGSQPALLIVGGSDDNLALRDGQKALLRAYRGAGWRDVNLRLYPGARHELINETCKEQVFEDVIAWLNAKCGS